MKVGDLVKHLGRPGLRRGFAIPGVHLILDLEWGRLKFVRIMDTNGKIWHSHIPHLEVVNESR